MRTANVAFFVKLKHFSFFILLALISFAGVHADHLEPGGLSGDGCHIRICSPSGRIQQTSAFMAPKTVSVVRRTAQIKLPVNNLSPCPCNSLQLQFPAVMLI
jgi:hypothetical protein